jgi:hypothetical protein
MSMHVLEVVMNVHVASYPSLRRRLIAERRTRALFFSVTTQQVSRASLLREITRAAIALAGVAAWGAVLTLLAA